MHDEKRMHFQNFFPIQNATFSTEVLIIVLIVIQLNYFLSKLVDKLILLGSIS